MLRNNFYFFCAIDAIVSNELQTIWETTVPSTDSHCYQFDFMECASFVYITSETRNILMKKIYWIFYYLLPAAMAFCYLSYWWYFDVTKLRVFSIMKYVLRKNVQFKFCLCKEAKFLDYSTFPPVTLFSPNPLKINMSRFHFVFWKLMHGIYINFIRTVPQKWASLFRCNTFKTRYFIYGF